jgi:AraC family transcriptional activator of pobA
VRFAGQSAKGVILERLAEEAQRRLIFTRASATKIGYALGFVEPSYFLRFFRKRTGMTPAQYRARHAVR